MERRGAAQGLAEVLLARRDLLPYYYYKEIIPRITSGKTKETKAAAPAWAGAGFGLRGQKVLQTATNLEVGCRKRCK